MTAAVEHRLGVVLVHGFNSSSAMWDPLCSLIAGDADLALVDPLPFAYATDLWTFDPRRSIPTFDTVADSLKEYLDTEAQLFRRLVVVSHSQGGLIVQRFLSRMVAEGRGAQLTRIRRIVMLACPNNGSQIALFLRRRLLRRNAQEHQLRPLDEQIADTQRIVLRDIINADSVTSRTCPIPFSVYAGESDNIVPPVSARSVFPDAAVLPGGHSGIARPDSYEHRTYTTLRRLILWALSDAVLPSGDRGATGDIAASASRPVANLRHIDASHQPSPVAGDDVGERLYVFPDTFTVVAAAERVSDMDDAAFRLMVVSLMKGSLAPDAGFAAAYRAHPRDHLVEIIERCRSHRDPQGALTAFVNVVAALRPDDTAVAELRTLIENHR